MASHLSLLEEQELVWSCPYLLDSELIVINRGSIVKDESSSRRDI